MKKYISVLCFVIAMHSYAQFSQQGSKLFGTGSSGSTPEQGISVALSADGNTAIVGGAGDSGGVGAAWIFTRSGGHWSQQGSKLVGTGAVGTSQQGNAVAISADGNTAIVGGYDDNTEVGAAWIFARSGGVWSQQGSKLVGNDYVGRSYQGGSVGISGDGNTAIVGGQYDNSFVGTAWIYKRTGNTWTQVGSKLVGSDRSGNSQAGCSVAMSGDGETAVVGGVEDSPYYGSAWIYVLNGSTWKQQGLKLTEPYNSAFGNSVSLSSDGNTVVVGGGGDYDYAGVGAVWVFVRSLTDSTWTLQGNKLVPSDYTGAPEIGTSASISGDGNTAIVGGNFNDSNAGAAWIFKRSTIDSVWSQQGTKLVGTDSSGAARQGYGVAISADGNTALVGGYADSNYAGATWVYATPSAPLPVELSSFTVSPNRLSTELHWTTVTEINSAEFEVQRTPCSSLKEEGIQRWGPVGSIAGAGTSNSPKNYSYTDNVGVSGTYLYRLKQIDRNGEFKYSQAIQVQIGAAPNVFELSQNYPNPFNPTTTINFTVPSDGRATLKVYNEVGQEVATLFDDVATAGEYHQATFDASRFASGVYLARLRFGNTMQMKKLLLLK